MSLTLGEKLRQAREERGFTLGDVAEQTRISALYLESIENDDYRILPGGIFNKGFVKSYAKFVGIGEAEALADYGALMSTSSKGDEEELKVYRPQVLTDDRATSSMLPTIILAAVILGLITAAGLFVVNYWQTTGEQVANTASTPQPAGTAEPTPEPSPATGESPTMASVKVEFKALTEQVSLSSTNDGKYASSLLAPGTAATFEPRESLKLSYSRSLANAVQLTINGKLITLPAQPLVPRRNAIEFEINKDNLSQIWTSGSISSDVPAASPAPPADPDLPANVEMQPSPTPVSTVVPPPVKTPSPRPTTANTVTNTASNAAPRPTPDRRPANTPAAKPPASNNLD